MSVKTTIAEKSGVYFITFTCYKWIPLFQITNGYAAVYKWFDTLRQKGHYIVSYVIMPNHIHVIIAFTETEISINKIVGNGKRFIAYQLIQLLKQQHYTALLDQLANAVSSQDQRKGQIHRIFMRSFDIKECKTQHFIRQKTEYIHNNPCRKANLQCLTPEDYMHSSALYYITGQSGIYPVVTYMELQDISLSS